MTQTRMRTITATSSSLLAVGALLSLLVSTANAQLPPIKPAPLSSQVPQGGGACSIEKSCSDLAPVMDQIAMGVSPLEENLRYLSDSIGGRVTGAPAAGPAAGWGVHAFRPSGGEGI